MNNKDNKEPLVSIACITYNQEKYVRQCLDGFVMQKTNFKFEIVIHDDASTDNTPSIIREYCDKYPGLFVPILQTQNKYKEGKGILIPYVYPKCKGKYIALCEGDDYWTDPLKLQKQVNILEADASCSLVISNALDYYMSDNSYRNNNPLKYTKDTYVPIEELLLEKGNLIPTASMVFRTEYKEMPLFFQEAPVGDRPLRMWCAINGNVYYFVKPMLVHRIGAESSFASRINRNSAYAKSIFERMCFFYTQFNIFTEFKYDTEIAMLINKEEFVYYHRVGDWHSLKSTQHFKGLSLILKMKYYIKFYFLGKIKLKK